MNQPTPPPQSTLDWLYRVLGPIYSDVNRVYADAVGLITNHPTLKLKTDVYTNERGQSELLLCLWGTIPTVFAGATYRIPVMLWIPREYPSVGPVAFVKPTETMLIHPGNHVDASGRCYHPYLSYWQNGNISEFVEIMIQIFSKEPPVYAKPPSYQPPVASPPPPPPPMERPVMTPVDPANTRSIIEEDIDVQPQAAPVRPPNPEKMQAIEHLKQQVNKVKHELDTELATDDRALEHTEQTLAWMETQLGYQEQELDRLNAACNENETILTDRIEQAKRVVHDARNRNEPDIDAVVCAENVVFNQLYDLVAEDHAIDDTIYMLGKIHDKDKISLDLFMKHTRTLAREQFLKRALICKISSTIQV